MEQQQLYSDWQSSASRIFWGIVLSSILTVFCNFYDAVAWLPILIEVLVKHSQQEDISIWESKFFLVSVTAKLIIIVGYVMYLTGLTSFAQIQQTANAARYVYRARTAVIMLIITSVVFVFFGFVMYVPFVGILFLLLIWLLYVIAYFIMASAYKGLMHCDDFSGIAKLGAKNVHYSAVCMLRLLFAPIFIFIIFVGFFLSAGVSTVKLTQMATSMHDIQQGAMGLLFIAGLIGFLILIFLICWSVCAFIWPMMGWYRIKNGGPADVMIVVETDEAEAEPQPQATREPTTEETTEAEEKVETTEEQEPQENEQEQDTTGDNDWTYDAEEPENRRKLYYTIGAAVAAVAIGAALWFGLSGSDKNNNPLGVQKPKWDKFVMVNTEKVPLYKDAATSSPRLMGAWENLDSDVAMFEFRWADEGKKRGYTVRDYYLDEGTIMPVIEETENWYKVQVEENYSIPVEAYVEKDKCTEVTPEPITADVLKECGKNTMTHYRLVEKGKLRNLVCKVEFDDMEGFSFEVGALTDNCIVYPQQRPLNPVGWKTSERLTLGTNEETGILEMTYEDGRELSFGDSELSSIDPSTLTEEELMMIIDSVRIVGQEYAKISYYFPSVSKETLCTFTCMKSSMTPITSDEEAEPVATEYKVEGEKLKAWLGDEERTVKLNFENINLIGVKDLDGDGSMEAVICHFMSAYNGEPVDCPIVVYYDAEADEFKHTEGMELTVDPTFEENGDGYTILQREGLKAVRYKFAEGKLTVTDDSFKSIGHVIGEIKLDELFEFGTDGEKTVGADFFGNAPDDVAKLTFEYKSGGYYHGLKMELTDIELLNGETHSFVSIVAYKFKFLKEKTNGMPDIIGDNYLYRWDGNSYERYGWDGKNFVKCDY